MLSPDGQRPYISHYMAELFGVPDRDHLDDPERLHSTFLDIAKEMKMTVVDAPAPHRFEPYGISFTMILAESHMSVHSWPEIGYLNVDAMVCSPRVRLFEMGHILQARFNPEITKFGAMDYHPHYQTALTRQPIPLLGPKLEG